MRKSIVFLLLFFITTTFEMQGQTSRINRNDNFYLTINENENFFIYDTNHPDNTEKLYQEHTLHVKRNSLDIYLNWINPLQYKLVIKDSLINDVRVDEIKKFFTDNVTGLAGGNKFVRPGSAIPIDFDCSTITVTNLFSALSPAMHNKFSASFTSDKELCKTWELATKMLELGLVKEENDIETLIKNLYNANNPEDARLHYKDALDEIKSFAEASDEATSKLYNLNENIKLIATANKFELSTALTSIYKANYDSYKRSKKLIELLKIYSIQIKTSLENKSNSLENHFRIKNLSLKKSKSIVVNVSLSKRELKSDFLIEDKAIIKSIKLLVQRYDFITPKIGTGIFYSSATLNGFGVSANDQNELVVTKNDIDKNTAVTGVFLNLNFDIGSQFLEPLLQIGVDPTKEKPYLLLGGGIAIPVSSFSISGGPIWTWEAQLNKLSEDETVTSTSVLEEDISYKFQAKPRGFYLGVNYSF